MGNGDIADQFRAAGVPERVDQVPGGALDHRQELVLEVVAAEGRRDQCPPDRTLAPVHLRQDPATVGRGELPGVVVGGDAGSLHARATSS